jgi:hypothetical protein
MVTSRIWWCEQGVALLTPPNPGVNHFNSQRAKSLADSMKYYSVTALSRTSSRSRCTSCMGGTPKRLLYSRLKWEASWYPTR